MMARVNAALLFVFVFLAVAPFPSIYAPVRDVGNL